MIALYEELPPRKFLQQMSGVITLQEGKVSKYVDVILLVDC